MRINDNNIQAAKGRFVLVAILACGFISTLGIGLFSFTVPLASLDEKVSGAWLGSAFAGFYLAKLLISPLAGIASDKFGPRLPLMIAATTGCAAPLFYFYHQSIEVLYAIQFVMGLVSGLIKPVGMAVLGSNTSTRSLSRYFALNSLVFNIALFTGPLLGGYLYLDRSMAPIILALSGCMALTIFILAALLPRHQRTVKKSAPKHLAHSLKRTATFALLLAISGRTVGIGLLATFYPILLTTTLGQSGLVVALAYAIPGLATCIGLIIMNRLYGERPNFMIVASGMLVSAIALFALSQCHELWQFICCGVIMGIGAAISIPPSMTLASSISRHQGMVFGTAHFASGTGLLAGPIIGGLLVQNLHSVAPALTMAATIGILACMPLLAVGLDQHSNWKRSITWGALGIVSLGILIAAFTHFDTQRGSAPFNDEGLYHFTDVAMGTIVKLTLEAGSQKAADDAARKTIAAMRTLQQDFDFRNLEGSVGRINRNAGKGWVKPTRRVFDLLQRTSIFSEQSNGIFDPTIGALTTSPLYYALDETVARSKKDLVDYRLILFDKANRRVRLKKAGMALDLGGIAKGTIIDTAVGLLKKQNIHAGIVEAGGDFYCFGDRDWIIGIRHPRNKALFNTVSVRNQGVCGSGDYQQFVTIGSGGKTQLRHHIINPSTMKSATESIGVTVLASSAERADALATTLFIMGPDSGNEFILTHYPQEAAIWFTPEMSIIVTDNFPK